MRILLIKLCVALHILFTTLSLWAFKQAVDARSKAYLSLAHKRKRVNQWAIDAQAAEQAAHDAMVQRITKRYNRKVARIESSVAELESLDV